MLHWLQKTSTNPALMILNTFQLCFSFKTENVLQIAWFCENKLQVAHNQFSFFSCSSTTIKEMFQVDFYFFTFTLSYEDPNFDSQLCSLVDIEELPQKAVLKFVMRAIPGQSHQMTQ